MSRLSGRLRSGSVRLVCEALGGEDCSEPEGSWMGDMGPGVTSAGTSGSDTAASLHYRLFSPPSLANGLRSHDEQFQRRARRRRQMDHVEQTHMHEQIHFQSHTHPQMHIHQQPLSQQQSTHTEHSNTPLQSQMHIQMDTHVHTERDVMIHKNTHTEMGRSSTLEEDTSLVPEDLSITSKTETYTSLVHSTHPLHTKQLSQNYSALQTTPEFTSKVDTEKPSHTSKPEKNPFTAPELSHSSSASHNPINTPMDAERKYTLRSSGRPRFPCHLRKSSRLRRAAEDNVMKREVEQKETEEDRNIWGGEDIRPGEECPLEMAVATSSPVDLPAPTNSIHMVPNHNVGMPFGKATSESGAVIQISQRAKQRGRFLGVRKIVVKIARIPVHLSRRQKSYKISSLEPVAVGSHVEGSTAGEAPEGGSGGEIPAPISREPTALLRMKNNGKSVMVMFPPGELPVILKRRRGRPPKQALPGQPDMRETRAGAASAAEPKKPRRRRRVKLPSPLPSYVNDTNDVKVEYADVLSKLAFLNRQPPTTGRCSPPRCWTPTEPETFHTSPENPNLSTLLHRLTGFRRRGGRAGCMGGRGGGMTGCSEAFKRSFSDFFETIGKKRKVPLSEPGTPRKRGKGLGGGMKRATLNEQGSLVAGEKIRKRRSRKNGTLKGGQGGLDQDWQNGNSGWGEKCDPDLGSHQGSCSPRGGFPSSETGKGGIYHSPGMRGASNAEECQGMFAGYFRSLLDSDDSSDLLDISMSSPTGHQDARKITPGYEGNSPGAAHCWSPAVPKRSPKVAACTGEGSSLSTAQSHSSSANRTPFLYSVSQTSPTTSFPKSPALSLSRSPSSPHPSGCFSQYSSTYSGNVPQGAGVCQGTQQQPRSSDCSFAYGNKTSPASSTQRHINYSSYQASAKRHYSAYPGSTHVPMQQNESIGPSSPSGSYMSISKSSSFSSSSSPPEGSRQYHCSAPWGYRQGGSTWGGDGFGTHQFHPYSDYGVSGTSAESKDILDISNYTPQKAKQRPCPDTFSESSSDSSHTGIGNMGGAFCPRDAPVSEGQSSLSSLEKLMLDWNENSAGPSYNWSQNVLFQGGTKPGRGRKKRAEAQSEKEMGHIPPGSPASPPVQAGGPKRSASAGRQPRGSRGRGGFSPCQRERSLPPKSKLQKPAAPTTAGQIAPSGGLYQETLDYYSGDSSSLSPLSHAPELCEYPSPYSAHTSTPSSDERFAHIYPSDSASLSPSLSIQSDALKQHPKPTPPPQTYGHTTRTFSPTLSPSPRLPPQCSSALSPHRVPKDQFPQYDSPSYSSSPCWYGQGGSVAHSPQSYEELRSTAITMPSHKRDMSLISPGMRAPSHSSYTTPLLRGHTMSSSCVGGSQDSSPQHEELGFHGNMDSYAPVGHRYVSQSSRGGVLCQLLDQPSDEGFTVTSL
ncbi:transcription factor Gibbin [Clarias gariepinus]|uniref:transcription factor Gibbin n=1 Tax=Clarias gariepinus TaxID=13013 RepID=UPI00234CB517|nr:transcription factor Gibbin [Clarias gariepinus]XP_053347595.1 transcription factor Gibbin [Clarias gariepinus]